MTTVTRPKVADFVAAKRLARQVLQDNGITEPPIIAADLVVSYGLEAMIAVFQPGYDHIAGFIDFDEFKIYVNGDDSLQRQNFTIAHELGHYLLGHRKESGYTVLLRNPDEMVKTPIEKEANCFAANLLVPEPFLLQYLEDFPGITNYQLTKIFGVSTDVIHYRRLYVK